MGASRTRERRSQAVATAVFVSGNGTNLQAVIDAARAGAVPLDIKLVVSNRQHAFALERARREGIPAFVVRYDKNTEDRAAYALRLASVVRKHSVRLVLLLGWMHVLAEEFLNAGFDGILNLHPAYLPEDPRDDVVQFEDGTQTPAYRGARALRDALEAKAPYVGASLIEITKDVDRGPLFARKAMRLHKDDDEVSALERLHAVEAEVVREGVLRWIERRKQA